MKTPLCLHILCILPLPLFITRVKCAEDGQQTYHKTIKLLSSLKPAREQMIYKYDSFSKVLVEKDEGGW